ncbi:MAG: PfkB family carbohydrate kinase [Candidatus Hadarchaeales archaeon]
MVEVVIVGHFAIDINTYPWGTIENALGGAPIYGGLTAVSLGFETGIVSKVGRDFVERFPPLFSKLGLDTEGILVSGKKTTTFENIYDEKGNRKQVCRYVAPEILPQDVPGSYRGAKAFYVSPIAGEISAELLASLKTEKNVVALDPQGILRKIEKNGNIKIVKKDLREYLRYVDILKIGKEESVILGPEPKSEMKKLAEAGPSVVIVTRGEKTSIVLHERNFFEVPSLKVDARSMTGAGDVFGTAFLCRYLKRKDVIEAARFASVAAGLKIRYHGPVGFPSEDEVLQAMKSLQ